MATGFKKPCKFPGVRCCNLTEPGQRYCPEHMRIYERQERGRHKEYKSRRRDSKEQAFYSSTDWRKARAWKLKHTPICEICRMDNATMVDHIVPIKQGGAGLDPNNLQSLCQSCHNRKTAREFRR